VRSRAGVQIRGLKLRTTCPSEGYRVRAKERRTMQFDLACAREPGAVETAMQRLTSPPKFSVADRTCARTDNLASRRTKINNARCLASPSQIVVSHTGNTRRLSSLSVTRSLRLASCWLMGDGYGETFEWESLRSMHHAMRRSACGAAGWLRKPAVYRYKIIFDLTLINSRMAEEFQLFKPGCLNVVSNSSTMRPSISMGPYT